MRVEIPNQISVKIGGIISRGVKAVEVTDEGKLIFTLTDGSAVDLGSVIGPAGPKGDTGPAGPTGPAGAKGDTGTAGASIASIEKTAQSGTTSTYTITMSDGQAFDFEVQSDKGEKGDKGDTGATGPKGPQGEQGPAGIVVQETEPAGPDHPVWVNPKGGASDPGVLGKDGTTFTPAVSASGDLSWTNDGGKENPETVNIKGPQGEPGEKGDKGDTGSPGAKGDTGATPNLQIGTVETLPAGSDATASMGGTAENPLLNLGIPKGADGTSGSSTITTSTETDIAGLLMGEDGKVRKAVPDVDYRATKELPTPTNVGDSGQYLRWFENTGWTLGGIDIVIALIQAVGEQYYCDRSPSDVQEFVTAGQTIFAMLNGEPYFLASVSDQSAVFTRVAGTTVETFTVSADYTAVRTTATIPSPDTKTAAQTQPVGMDTDGKLWTQPGGGASGAETWDLIKRVTIDTDDIATLTINKDENDEAFAYYELRYIIQCPSTISSADNVMYVSTSGSTDRNPQITPTNKVPNQSIIGYATSLGGVVGIAGSNREIMVDLFSYGYDSTPVVKKLTQLQLRAATWNNKYLANGLKISLFGRGK